MVDSTGTAHGRMQIVFDASPRPLRASFTLPSGMHADVDFSPVEQGVALGKLSDWHIHELGARIGDIALGSWPASGEWPFRKMSIAEAPDAPPRHLGARDAAPAQRWTLRSERTTPLAAGKVHATLTPGVAPGVYTAITTIVLARQRPDDPDPFQIEKARFTGALFTYRAAPDDPATLMMLGFDNHGVPLVLYTLASLD